MAQTISSSDLGTQNPSQLDQQPGQGGSTPPGTPKPQASGAEAQPAGGGYQQNTGQPSGGSNASSAAPAYNPNKQQGSGYTNIQSVLNANKNNQLGQVVGGGIQNQTSQAQNNLNQSQQQFNQATAANQANTTANSQLVQNVLGNNTAQYAAGGANQAQGQQFGQLISGQYAGPTALNNAQQIQNQAQNVQQLGAATGSQAGQMGLLQQFVGSPQYTQGQQSLDQLLLGQGNQSQLQAARRGALQLQGQVGGALAGAQATGQQEQQQAQQFGQNVQNQFGQTVSGINSGLQQQAQTAQQGANQQYQSTLQALQSGNINQQQANLLGLNNGEQVTADALQNVGQYLQQNPNQATAQNVASAQNYAQLQALQQLGGSYAPSAAQNTLQQYAGQSGNAGAFNNQQQIIANAAGFNAANTGQVNNYNSIVNPAQSAMTNANQILHDEQVAYNNPGTAAAAQAWQQLQGQYSGALGGNASQNAQWATNNAGAQQAAYQQALASANAATGGLRNITITPQQAALQQIQGNS